MSHLVGYLHRCTKVICDSRKLHNVKNELISTTFTKNFFQRHKKSTQTTHHVMEENRFLFQTVSLEEDTAVFFWKVVCYFECFCDDVEKLYCK